MGADSTLWTGGSGSDVWLTTNAAADVVTFDNFSSGVYAAGGYIFGSDISGLFLRRGSVTVSATDASGTTTVTQRFAKDDNFFGFVSDSSLTSVTVSATSGRRASVWPTINNLTLAAAVPEPETYALLLSGLAVIGFIAAVAASIDRSLTPASNGANKAPFFVFGMAGNAHVRKSWASHPQALHGHRTHQLDRRAACRPEHPDPAAPGVSLTTTASPAVE